jgi:ABC-type transport system substrate-binding protein
MNTRDKIGDEPNPLGGFTKERIALRRAIAMAYNLGDQIRIIRKNQAVKAEYPIPPGVTGHEPTWKNNIKYDPAGANVLLDRVGYKKGPDGFRMQPDGKPLILKMGSSTSAQDREFDEFWLRTVKPLGLRVEFIKQKWPDLLKASRLGQLQMWQLGNINTTPDGFGFFGLLYGKNAGFSNLARFQLPEFDRLYEKARAMPDGPERLAVERKMSELVNAYAPWVLTAFRYESVLVQPWLRGFKYNPTFQYPFAYLDVERGGTDRAGSGAASASHPDARASIAAQ